MPLIRLPLIRLPLIRLPLIRLPLIRLPLIRLHDVLGFNLVQDLAPARPSSANFSPSETFHPKLSQPFKTFQPETFQPIKEIHQLDTPHFVGYAGYKEVAMMQTVMRLRVPQDDLTALDQICGSGNRSEYLRGVFNSYLEDKKKVLAVFESTLGGFYDQKNCSNVTNGT